MTPTTTTDIGFPATGSLKITRLGKVVKTWALTSSDAESLTWDGKVSGKVVPGTYTVTASVKGPEGSSHSATTTVKVDSGKLVTKTRTITYKAAKVLRTFSINPSYPGAYCEHGYRTYDDVHCVAKAKGGNLGLIAYGYATVPSDVLSATKYGSATARASVHLTWKSSAQALWSTDRHADESSTPVR